MAEFLRFMFYNGWSFLAAMLLLVMALITMAYLLHVVFEFVYKLWDRFLSCVEVCRSGWPPDDESRLCPECEAAIEAEIERQEHGDAPTPDEHDQQAFGN